MAQAATAPLPLSPVHGAHDAREQERGTRPRNSNRHASIEERTTALEIRWEVTIPTLATKTDIINLENRLLRWGIGAGIALLGVFAAVFIANTTRMDALDAKLDARFDALSARQDKLDAKIDAVAARQNVRMDALDAKVDRLNGRIDRLDEKLDARFDALMAEIRALGRAQ